MVAINNSKDSNLLGGGVISELKSLTNKLTKRVKKTPKNMRKKLNKSLKSLKKKLSKLSKCKRVKKIRRTRKARRTRRGRRLHTGGDLVNSKRAAVLAAVADGGKIAGANEYKRSGEGAVMGDVGRKAKKHGQKAK